MATLAMTTNAQAELDQLASVLSSSLVTVRATTDRLTALKNAKTTRAVHLANLEADLANARAQAKSRGLAGLEPLQPIVLRRRARASSLGDLAGGASAWERGQEAKINDWANQGYYSTMLEAAMRLAVSPTTEPEDALRELGSFNAIADTVARAVLVDAVRARALAALASMRAGALGQPTALELDRDEYDAAVQGDLRYVATHQPNSGFLEKALRQTAEVTSTLDHYVPGWAVLLDVASPVLPIAPLLHAILGTVPLVGRAAQIASGAVPGLGPGGGLVPNYAPFAYGAAGPSLAPQIVVLDAPIQTITGPAGVIKFQVTKSAAESAANDASALDALEKLGSDLVDGYALAAELAGAFVAGPELEALRAGIQALKAAISLKRAMDAAAALKKAADKAQAAAFAEAVTDDAKATGLRAELDAILRRLGQLKARLATTAKAASSSGLGQLAAGLALVWLASEVLS